MAWGALKKNEKNRKTWALNKSRWFDNKITCRSNLKRLGFRRQLGN